MEKLELIKIHYTEGAGTLGWSVGYNGLQYGGYLYLDKFYKEKGLGEDIPAEVKLAAAVNELLPDVVRELKRLDVEKPGKESIRYEESEIPLCVNRECDESANCKMFLKNAKPSSNPRLHIADLKGTIYCPRSSEGSDKQ